MKQKNLHKLIKLLNDFMVEYNGYFYNYKDLSRVSYAEILEAFIKAKKFVLIKNGNCEKIKNV